MQGTYDLVGRDTYPLVRLKNRGDLLNYTNSQVATVDYLEILRFVPKAMAARTQDRRQGSP